MPGPGCNDLARTHAAAVDLGTVPDAEWDALASLGFDAVWLMGVWERSPAGIAISMRDPALLEDFRRALPDFIDADNVGSPYCVRRYVVDAHFGGPGGLAAARRALSARGIRLVLDFVPNHVAPDHPWVRRIPSTLFKAPRTSFARPLVVHRSRRAGFGVWSRPLFSGVARRAPIERLQPGLRQAVVETISIAGQCDGVRCDMSMLLMNTIFEGTWGAARVAAGRRLLAEISGRKGEHPASGSLPKRIGTWSGSFSGRASTTATTSGSTTAWITPRPRCKAAPPGRPGTRKGLYASSRTMTSPGRQSRFRAARGGRRR